MGAPAAEVVAAVDAAEAAALRARVARARAAGALARERCSAAAAGAATAAAAAAAGCTAGAGAGCGEAEWLEDGNAGAWRGRFEEVAESDGVLRAYVAELNARAARARAALLAER